MDQNRLNVELKTIEKVSVLSTDGQEVTLNLPVFLGELDKQGKELHQTARPLQSAELRYTLIVQRRGDAPLVIEVGKEASQIGNLTYSGSSAVNFYHWIRELTAGSLFTTMQIQKGDLHAGDLNRSLSLDERQIAEITSYLRNAKYHPIEDGKHYPLYPDYRLKLENGERTMEITLLTPTLLSVQLGRETLQYDVSGQLFSLLTEWLPLHASAGNPLDQLYKTRECELVPGRLSQAKKQSWKMDQSIEIQAILHQIIRKLHEGVPAEQSAAVSGREQYSLLFQVNGKEHVLKMYEQVFSLDGKYYRHRHLDKTVLQLLGSMQK
jgi:hypothetical protein